MDIHKDNWDALKQKHYSELTTYDAAFIHLSQVPFFELKGCRIASSLWEMQLELNAVSARPKTAGHSPYLLGFALLEQVGRVYQNLSKTAPSQTQQNVSNALHYFNDIVAGSNESKALIAFRNILSHRACLAGTTIKGDSYIFRFDGTQSDMIKFPSTPWDGTNEDFLKGRVTWINPTLFKDMIGTTIRNLRQKIINDPANLKIRIDANEIKQSHLYILPS